MLKIAVSERDITPREPLDICGFALRQNPSVGINDPLKIRFLSLRDSYQNRVLLGAADVLSFSRETFRNLRDDIHAVNDSLAEAHVAIATSHTHSGPATVLLRKCGKMDRGYLSWMKGEFVAAASQADVEKHRSVEVFLGTAEADVSINRRQGEAAEVDRKVRVISFRDPASGKPLANIINFACHPVVLGHENRLVSADFPGLLCAQLEEDTGAAWLFLNGAAGDINPRVAHSSDPADAQKVAEELAKAARQAMAAAEPIKFGRMGWYRQNVQIPCRVPESVAEIESRVAMIHERFGLAPEIFANRVQHDKQMLANGTYPESVGMELTLLTFGRALGILFVPGELFSSIGLRAQRLAAPLPLVISGFSNGSVGYLSDRQAYVDGGYEPYFANFFYDFPEFDPSLEDSILEGVQRLLKASRNG